MNVEEKLEMLKTILDIPSSDSSEDSRLTVYLSVAEREIIGWRYSYGSQTVETVPAEYEMVQVFAVVAGYSQSGAENQLSHSENSISRTFSYPDMVHYIRANVIPLCGVL
jgi:hypothetical protein